MDNLIVTTESRLVELIECSVSKLLKAETPKNVPENISGTTAAVSFLKENGFDLSESLFTKSTARGLIPCKRFHNKRLLFNKKDLLLWAESKCEPIGHSDVALSLAANANRKMRGRK